MWTNKEIIEILIQAAVALGTISAAIFSLYGDRIRRWLFKPKLTPHADSDKPYVQICKKDISNLFSENREFETIINIRLKILNEGKLSAIKTQGFIESIYKKRQNNTYFEVKKIPPTSLPWHNDETVYSIVPNVPAYLNIGVIQKFVETVPSDNQAKKENNDYFLNIPINDDSKPSSYINLKKGTFIIPLNLYCESYTKPQTFYFEIFWNGLTPDKLETSTFYFKKLNTNELPAELNI